MRKIISIISLLLIASMLIAGCSPTDVPDSDQESSSALEESTTPAETQPPQPQRDTVELPIPYIDINFTGGGTVLDSMGHVTCLLYDQAKGSVVTKNVMFGGKSYETCTLEVREAGGVALLKYEHINSSNELLALLRDGFTMEAFLVNHNTLSPSDNEQCMISSCQSGGYNFTTHQGQYKLSVYTDGSYRNPTLNKPYSTNELTHLVGIYDPISQTAALYVNGDIVSEVSAPGMLALAQSEAWRTIALGGDINGNGKPTTLCQSIDITDFKLYTTAVHASQAQVMYEAAVSELTGTPLDYNVVYTLPSVNENSLFASISDSYVTDVYEPQTALVSAPTVLQYASHEFVDVAFEEKRPATVIFGILQNDGVLYGTDASGTPVGELYSLVKALNKKAIPAFVIDKDTATTVRDFINENQIGDCFVICADENVLDSVCGATRAARPVLDCRKLSAIAPSDIYLRASKCGSKVIIANADDLNNDSMLALRSRSLAVFIDPQSTNVVDIHNAMFLGAAGIVTTDYKAVISYYETFTEPTLSAPPLIVAHRGDIANYPHNVMSSFISAAQSGANITELDVWMTADGHLVLNHDATTTGFDKNLSCNESTREQLKALKSTNKFAAEGDEIAFYDELMEYFSKNYTDMVFIVEIKDKRNEVVDLIMEQTRQYGMEGRILIICMTHSIVRYAYETYGIGIQMNRSYLLDRADIEGSLAPACIECAMLKTSFFTRWVDASQPFSDMLRHRGIKYSPWTTDSPYGTDADYLAGYPEFTTNYPHQTDTYVRRLSVSVADDGTLTVTRINYNGETQDITKDVTFVRLSGNVSLKDGKLQGNGDFTVSYKTKLPLYNKKAYCVYSPCISY